MDTRLYEHMQSPTTSGKLAIGCEPPAAEISDFDQVVQTHRERILRFVFASVRDMDLAETLTQDCFLKAHRKRNMFRGDCAVHTWLMKIAVNLVRDHMRIRKFQFWRQAGWVPDTDVLTLPEHRQSPEAATMTQEKLNAVWEATGTLPNRQRTVFLLRFVEDMDIADIALSTGLSRNAVHVHLFRAVRSIRSRLGPSL